MAIKILEVPADAPDEQTTIAQRSHDRDDEQKAMDARVAELVKEWEAAGKPAQADAPYRRLGIPKDQKTDLKKLIRRAMVLNKVDPLYWNDTKPNSEGVVFVKFTVGPQKPKEKKNAETPAETPAVTPPAPPTGSGDEGTDQPQSQPDAQKRGGLLSGRR